MQITLELKRRRNRHETASADGGKWVERVRRADMIQDTLIEMSSQERLLMRKEKSRTEQCMIRFQA